MEGQHKKAREARRLKKGDWSETVDGFNPRPQGSPMHQSMTT